MKISIGPWTVLFEARRRRESNLVEHAKRELRIAGLYDEGSDYGGMMADAVVAMIEQFSDEGHSGASAGMAVSIFEKLARFEPITPLTGEDDEWTEVGEGMFQNRRCSRVFKNADGSAYDIDGRIFREPSGACFTSRESSVPVTFPYTPKTEYVDASEAA